jgi:hypothetical protein
MSCECDQAAYVVCATLSGSHHHLDCPLYAPAGRRETCECDQAAYVVCATLSGSHHHLDCPLYPPAGRPLSGPHPSVFCRRRVAAHPALN